MKIECLEGIPCPKRKKDSCCYDCKIYSTCDFEDKCVLTSETCGNDNYKSYEERKS